MMAPGYVVVEISGLKKCCFLAISEKFITFASIKIYYVISKPSLGTKF